MNEFVTVHDIIVLGARSWAVTSVCLGALGQESLVGLQSLDRGDGTAYGVDVPEAFVPEVILREGIVAGLLAVHRPTSGGEHG